jgi:uncharacterized phage protein (TIGR01671 family)
MREIKFRGRRLDNGEWVCGNLITPTFDNSNIIFGYYIYEMNKTNYFSRGESKLEDFYEMPLVGVDPKTVGQLTGLTDRNGKEAYDGDVVKTGNSIGVIVYDQDSFVIEWKVDRDFWNEHPRYHVPKGEIIGNLYENPELLEVTT